MASSSPPSSSSSSVTLHQARRTDVFLSFRGEDSRSGFTSHLHDALCKNQILTFIDDNMKRGHDIAPSLVTAIEESTISVVIFSENYADSRWCLKELAKIIECKHRNGQIVIPVFYEVDPSHIKKQIGKFGAAFDKLKERVQEGEMDWNQVKSHLEEAATISGWSTQTINPESKLIKEIVGDILNKLNRVTLNLPSSLIGIGSYIERVETLLCLESTQVRIVGLWGMGGICKTTIARAVFDRIYSTFDGFHFAENVSEELRNQSVDGLRKEIVARLFEEESLNMGARTLRHDFIMKQLQHKKVLIVLDDVNDVLKAKKLLVAERHLFCGGSRVLITSRDKQLLKNIVDEICEVDGLNEEDGLQLFSLHAFKQNHPPRDQLDLSERVLSYARGNPLAIVVSGCALFNKSKEEWISAVDGLKIEPFPEILDVLKISYDALGNQEKKIFLDVASFLLGKTLEFIVAYYTGFMNGTLFTISKLVDRSLITISKNKQLEMHDLLKEMGLCIDREESPNNLKERTRIWDTKDVVHVLEKRKGGSMIEAISVDLSQVESILHLDCDAFAKLDGLRFLEFHGPVTAVDHESKVKFRGEHLEFPTQELRYFRWDAFPLIYLPSKFCVEHLVEIHMEDSEIKELWTGKQNIQNLKVINLDGAKNLVEFPDVSEAKNIQEIRLGYCASLVKVSSSVQYLPKLQIFALVESTSCGNVPNNFDSKLLEHLNLNDCRGIKMFPEVSLNIRELQLNETDITEVPSSVEFLKRLETLSMRGCKNLSIISTNICKLESLCFLDLSDCPNLESFPEILEPMECLTYLYLNGCQRLKSFPNCFHNLKSVFQLRLNDTGITELPSSIQHLIALDRLVLFNCKNLTSLPSCIHNMRNLKEIDFGDSGIKDLPALPEPELHLVSSAESAVQKLYLPSCSSLEISDAALLSFSSLVDLLLADNNCESLPESIGQLSGMRNLDLSACKRLRSLPETIVKLFNLRVLGLSYCVSLGSLPPNFKQLSKLQDLHLECCSSLEFLPELPSSLEILNAHCCSSLKTISSGCFSECRAIRFMLANCFKLDDEGHREILDTAYSKLQDFQNSDAFELMLPGSDIPEWFCSQSHGSSLTCKLPLLSNCRDDELLCRFAFCVGLKPNESNSNIGIDFEDIRITCSVKPTFHHQTLLLSAKDFFAPLCDDVEHLFLWYNTSDDGGMDDELREYLGSEVSLEFCIERGAVEVTRCGVYSL